MKEMKMKMESGLKQGDYKGDMGNSEARRERKRYGSYSMRKRKGTGGRAMYGTGGMTMEGSQPKYDGMPKCMPN
jgi:hypothetical protein|tara:strand:+ start:1229 stop:1450 length:222 start_codon:yes stop_codon:yes gene_type:complete